MHFVATPETSALLCGLKNKLAASTGISRREAGHRLAEFIRETSSLAHLQARIALECDFAAGKVVERRDESADGSVATYRLVAPKAKTEAEVVEAPTLADLVKGKSPDEIRAMIEALASLAAQRE